MVAASIVATAVVVACTQHDPTPAVHADVPATQTARLVGSHPAACQSFSPFAHDESPPARVVSVDPDPTGATLLWYPGSHPHGLCRVEQTTVTAQAAQLLAADIRHAGRYRSGAHNCPDSTGREIDIYFSYSGQSQPEVVQIQPAGCAAVTAPGRIARFLAPPLRSDLRAIAPSDYRYQL